MLAALIGTEELRATVKGNWVTFQVTGQVTGQSTARPGCRRGCVAQHDGVTCGSGWFGDKTES